MTLFARTAGAILCLLPYAALPERAVAQGADLQNPNVVIEYRPAVATKAKPEISLEKLQQSQAWLQQNKFLERFAEFISPINFKAPLPIRAKTCDQVNAFYDGTTKDISFCYEILTTFQEMAAKFGKSAATSPADITSDDILIGGMGFTMLHELGHALFDLFKIPLFGRNEDGADQVAAFLALQLSPELAAKMVKGGAAFLKYAGPDPKTFADYTDNHGSSSQRFANIFCLAYGRDKVAFAYVAEQKLLPAQRLAGCAAEHRQVENAFNKTLLPHLDSAKLRAVRAKKDWFSRDFK